MQQKLLVGQTELDIPLSRANFLLLLKFRLLSPLKRIILVKHGLLPVDLLGLPTVHGLTGNSVGLLRKLTFPHPLLQERHNRANSRLHQSTVRGHDNWS